MHKILAAPPLMILVARGQQNLVFPSHDLKTRQLLYALTHSEVVHFKNLKPLQTLNQRHFPVLPEGHFWHFTGTDWTIRRLHHAPKALLDLDIYSRAGSLTEPAAAYTVSQNKQLVAGYVNMT